MKRSKQLSTKQTLELLHLYKLRYDKMLSLADENIDKWFVDERAYRYFKNEVTVKKELIEEITKRIQGEG